MPRAAEHATGRGRWRVPVALATDANALPLFVYREGGRHRSGAVAAVYPVAVNGWTAEEALREMDGYGFYDFLGLRSGYKRYVRGYFRCSSADPRSVPFALPRS